MWAFFRPELDQVTAHAPEAGRAWERGYRLISQRYGLQRGITILRPHAFEAVNVFLLGHNGCEAEQ
jgi:hypothetical protein